MSRPRSEFIVFLACIALASQATGRQCQQPDNGNGSADMPPALAPECPYELVGQTTLIANGLPAGTTIEVTTGTEVRAYFNNNEVVGGGLGGTRSTFDASLVLRMTGTGALVGFNRTIFLPVTNIVDHGPRIGGDAVQTFPGDWIEMSGTLFGDPDFDLIQFTAGSLHAAPPSVGTTTLTRTGLPGTPFLVDSFFDVQYNINFTGAPGSLLQGLSGVTSGNLELQAGQPPPACVPAMETWALCAVGLGLALAALRLRSSSSISKIGHNATAKSSVW